ncbi:MAG: PIN domain-containing protein [Kiritimatiellae bacterium]|nr:PIN domain-containing protein [Kiritimatiellia bacterium]
MNIFIDTNVLVDVVSMRAPFFDDSYRVFARVAKGAGNRLLVSDLAICTMAYLVRKQMDGDSLRSVLANLQKHLSIVPVGPQAISDAITNFTNDFEDEVQYRAALAAHADIIVTRDRDGFAGAAIPVMTPAEFLLECGRSA